MTWRSTNAASRASRSLDVVVMRRQVPKARASAPSSRARTAFGSLEVVEVLERLQERRLEDVSRLEARAEPASHLEADEGEQPRPVTLVQALERFVGSRERLPEHGRARRGVHRIDTLPRVR